MIDETEFYRRKRQIELNQSHFERKELEQLYGKVWDTTQLADEFEVMTFLAPFVVVVRKSDRQLGVLEFQHEPRYYFGFVEDKT